MCLLHNSPKVKLIFWWRRIFVENNSVKHCYPVGYGNDLLYYPKSSPKCPNSTRTRDEFVVLPKAFHQNHYSPRISPPEIPNNFPTVNQNLPKIASEEVIFYTFWPLFAENWGCATATDVMRSPFFLLCLVYSLRGVLVWWLFCNFGFMWLVCANCKCATKSEEGFFLLF